MWSELTSHMISTKYPFVFISTCLSLGNSACEYAPGTSNVLISNILYMYITVVVNRVSKETFGDDIIPHYFKYLLCLLPLAHDLPFTLTYCLNFIKFTASKAFFFKSCFKRSGSVGITKTFPGSDPSSICLISSIIVTIMTSPKCLMPYFSVIQLIITSMDVYKYDEASSILVYLILWGIFGCTKEYYFCQISSRVSQFLLLQHLSLALSCRKMVHMFVPEFLLLVVICQTLLFILLLIFYYSHMFLGQH